MTDQEYIAKAKIGWVVGDGTKQIALLVRELERICDEVEYVRSQAYCPNLGEFSRGYETACDEIVARIYGASLASDKQKQRLTENGLLLDQTHIATKQTQWIAVADRLPNDDEIVLVLCPRESEPVWLGYIDGDTGEWRDVSAAWIETGVTHWMPLPESPKQSQSNVAL